jgi:hypothetical protein
MEAPQETHRPFEGTGVFLNPQEGQVIEVGWFAAAIAR